MGQFFEFVSAHFFLVSAFVLLLVLFVANEMKRGGRSVSAQELVDLVNRDDALVVDVRERKEFAAGHIAGATNIPFQALDRRMDELGKHKEGKVVVVDKMGQHAGSAGTLLRKAGFQDVARLSGGMSEWRNSSLPVVKGG